MYRQSTNRPWNLNLTSQPKTPKLLPNSLSVIRCQSGEVGLLASESVNQNQFCLPGWSNFRISMNPVRAHSLLAFVVIWMKLPSELIKLYLVHCLERWIGFTGGFRWISLQGMALSWRGGAMPSFSCCPAPSGFICTGILDEHQSFVKLIKFFIWPFFITFWFIAEIQNNFRKA